MKKDDTSATRAAVATVRRICAKLPVSEEYVMVHHPAFRVGKKPFVIVGLQHAGEGAVLSVNLGRDMQHQLLDDPRFSKTPYIGQHGWVTISRDDVKEGELEALVTESWRRVATKKQLAQLDDAPQAMAKAARTKKVKPAR
jgi:predicted DNA-binding protein (MmcQ/YjbR family)